MSKTGGPFDFEALSEEPHLVTRAPLRQIGVDFLGLRSINFALMDEYFPGISNATRYVRAYTFMSWAWWKAYDVVNSSGQRIDAEIIRNYIDRLETLFTWGHRRDLTLGLPGGEGTPRGEGPSDLLFKSLGRDRFNTSLMAAVQYGPSLKSAQGLGFLSSLEGVPGVFRVTEGALPAVQAMDKRLRTLPEYSRFETFGPYEGTGAMADSLLGGWSVWKTTSREKEAFRRLFFPSHPTTPATKRRVATIQLIQSILDRAGEADSEEIRRCCTSGLLPSQDPLVLPESQEHSRVLIAVTQIRAAQRLGMEALFSWMEWVIQSGQATSLRDVEAIWLEAWGKVRDTETTSSALKRWGDTPRTKSNAIGAIRLVKGHNIFFTMEALLDFRREGQWEEVATTAFDLLLQIVTLVEAYGDSPVGKEIISRGEREGRWALTEFAAFVRSREEDPLAETFGAFLRTCIFSQHLATAVFRDVRDRTSRLENARRLRIAQGEFGLEAFAGKPSALALTPDRLETGLALMQGCDLCDGPPPEQNDGPLMYRPLH